MAGWPDGCVDFAFADPPYGVGKADWDSAYPESAFVQEMLRLARRGIAVTPGQAALGTCINSMGSAYQGVWVARNLNALTFNRLGFENVILCVVGGGARRGQTYTEFAVRGKKPDHPSPKPLELMQRLLERFTVPGDIVLDPFAGSGSTLVAAHSLGRRYIGIELNPEYVAIAEQRLAQRSLLAELNE